MNTKDCKTAEKKFQDALATMFEKELVTSSFVSHSENPIRKPFKYYDDMFKAYEEVDNARREAQKALDDLRDCAGLDHIVAFYSSPTKD